MSEAGESRSMPKVIESYRDLRVWQAAIELAVSCYELTKKFPASETYGLTSQIRRSGTSIAANIAEGYGRDNTGSYVQFLRVAQGSLKELETHVIIAWRVGYLQASHEEDLLHRSDEVGKMLRALIRGLQRTI
jgi:four helix bundle protein